jgi:ADP-ribosylglycohydrolase
MANGGIRHCGNCHFLKNDFCNIRNEKIESSHWTTCQNCDTYNIKPDGVIMTIVGEVKNRSISYSTIPYYNGVRADTIQDGYNDTQVQWVGKDGNKLIFKDVSEYLSFYETERIKKKKFIMGAIIGDVVGSVFEWDNVKTIKFPLFCGKSDFTDDSVLTVATMDGILNKLDYTRIYQRYGRKYPNAGYGGFFTDWIYDEYPEPYGSYGNGSSMRVSPVGWCYNTIEEVLRESKRSASVTHNHKEGIRGAQATASAIFLARTGKTKEEIKQYIQQTFNYDLERTLDEIRPTYKFNETCQGSVPEAIIAFLESKNFESSIRFAISLGGDSDTIGCITGGISEAFYKEIPEYIVENTLRVLPPEFVKMIEEFSVKYRK